MNDQLPSTSRNVILNTQKQRNGATDQIRTKKGSNNESKNGHIDGPSSTVNFSFNWELPDESPPSSPPREREIISMEVAKQRMDEKRSRERKWRDSETKCVPLDIHSSEREKLRNLSWTLSKPLHKVSDDIVPMVSDALRSFLCEISPSDRELFFNLINEEKSTTNNLREKVIEMMDVDYDTPEDTAKKYRIHLLSQDKSMFTDRQELRDRLDLEREGIRSLRPDKGNDNRMKHKKEEEIRKEMRREEAVKHRLLRRQNAIDRYLEVWNDIRDIIAQRSSVNEVTHNEANEVMHPEAGMRYKERRQLKDAKWRSRDKENEGAGSISFEKDKSPTEYSIFNCIGSNEGPSDSLRELKITETESTSNLNPESTTESIEKKDEEKKKKGKERKIIELTARDRYGEPIQIPFPAPIDDDDDNTTPYYEPSTGAEDDDDESDGVNEGSRGIYDNIDNTDNNGDISNPIDDYHDDLIFDQIDTIENEEEVNIEDIGDYITVDNEEKKTPIKELEIIEEKEKKETKNGSPTDFSSMIETPIISDQNAKEIIVKESPLDLSALTISTAVPLTSSTASPSSTVSIEITNRPKLKVRRKKNKSPPQPSVVSRHEEIEVAKLLANWSSSQETTPVSSTAISSASVSPPIRNNVSSQPSPLIIPSNAFPITTDISSPSTVLDDTVPQPADTTVVAKASVSLVEDTVLTATVPCEPAVAVTTVPTVTVPTVSPTPIDITPVTPVLSLSAVSSSPVPSSTVPVISQIAQSPQPIDTVPSSTVSPTIPSTSTVPVTTVITSSQPTISSPPVPLSTVIPTVVTDSSITSLSPQSSPIPPPIPSSQSISVTPPSKPTVLSTKASARPKKTTVLSPVSTQSSISTLPRGKARSGAKTKRIRSISPVVTPPSIEETTSVVQSDHAYSMIEVRAEEEEEVLQKMIYSPPVDSPAGRKLAAFAEEAKKLGKTVDMPGIQEKRKQQMLYYALHKWPKNMFPIREIMNFSREMVILYLGCGPIEPRINPTEIISIEHLRKLHTLKGYAIEKKKAIVEDRKMLKDSDRRIKASNEGYSKVPLPQNLQNPKRLSKLSKPIATSTPKPTSSTVSRLSSKNVKSQSPIQEETSFDTMNSPINPIILSPIRSQISEEKEETSRSVSIEERKRKSDDEVSEGEPDNKQRKKKEASITQGDANLEDEMELYESGNDDIETKEGQPIEEPIENEAPIEDEPSIVAMESNEPADTIRIEGEEKDIVSGGENDNRSDSDSVLLLGENATTYLLRGDNQDPFDMDDSKADIAMESTGCVVSIMMGTNVTFMPSSPISCCSNEFEAPDLNSTNFYLPARDVTTMIEEDKDDKSLVAARAEMDNIQGLDDEDGQIVGGKKAQRKTSRRKKLKDTEFKLFVYLLKSRFDDDLLPSQRHLRHFADIIQNKIVSPMKTTNPTEWSFQFYKLCRSELISSTIFEPVPRTFERDLLLLEVTEDFKTWRNGRGLSGNLLEEAVEAKDSPFQPLIGNTLALKDSFTLVRAKRVFRELENSLSEAFMDLRTRDEEDNEDFDELEKELTSHAKKIFIFSFFVISHDIGINNRSRTALRPYELLRVLAYVLEGWTGWMERGGAYRLFIAACDKREKEGRFVPQGKVNAEKKRDRIETRVAAILRAIRLVEDGGEELAVVYMLSQLKEKEILMASAKQLKLEENEGRILRCGHNLGNTKTDCILSFKTQQELQAHKNVAHLWREKENEAATKCSKCTRYFLMESSRVFHRLIAHYDYDDVDEGDYDMDDNEEEGEGEDEEEESDKKEIRRTARKLKREYVKSKLEWMNEKEVKEEVESPSKKGVTQMEE